MNNVSDWRGVMMDIRRAATPRGREAHGYFSIEGTRLHERAVRAGVTVESAVVAESYAANASPRIGELLAALESSGTRLCPAPDHDVQELTEGRKIGAIVGRVRCFDRPEFSDLLRSTARTLFLVGIEVEDPGNVGALVRTALASGAAAFIGVGLSDVYHPKAVRTSMGSLFKLPTMYYPAVESLLDAMRAHDVKTVAAVSKRGVALPQVDFRAPRMALLVGSEAHGLPAAVEDAMDQRVTIPMVDDVDSFSVNAAAAVALYEMRRDEA